ncbi:putative thioesterase [Calothrix sp. HK-06]|nr:putative thioesterase [Calothrix sp. HK-06]
MCTAQTSTRWICNQPNRQASKRMFCFPYAGAGASVFRNWSNQLLPEVEICPIQLPGREGRMAEPLFTKLSPLVEALSKALLPYLDLPFTFFGHSMGALVSFEVARFLQSHYNISPKHLFVSGRQAPQLRSSKPPIHQLPDNLFIEELRRYNGTPEMVLQNHELLSLFLPILRADFAINDTYTHTNMPLNCPITAFGGLQDSGVSLTDIAAWRYQTNSDFSMHMFPGDHFFIKNEREQLLLLIAETMYE